MATDYYRARHFLDRLLQDRSLNQLSQRLAPSYDQPAPALPTGCRLSKENLDQRWALLPVPPGSRESLADAQTLDHLEHFRSHVENFIGCVKLPVGITGPLRVNGLFARGDFYIPLATSESALVASYHRGAQLISEAGGCTAVLLNEGVSRAPGFAFNNLREVGLFVAWALAEFEQLKRTAEGTTRHGKLLNMKVAVEGNHVYLIFEFSTGDAAGQNMVTIATEAICNHIKNTSPIQPRYSFVEANLSGDKKATTQSFLQVRGKKVSAEASLPAALVERRLRATPGQIVDYWRMSTMGSVMSGSIGVQGHYANGLAALYLACGQDVACVAESAVGVTRAELSAGGDLYVSVTLPNLIIGTVGGGTSLPSQKTCLEIMGLHGPGNSGALAEVCAALCLAGELSIAGALAAGDFTRAHQCLGRREKYSPAKQHSRRQEAANFNAESAIGKRI